MSKSADRTRIDWSNLEPLPRRRLDAGASRDDLAARKFNIGKAHHKGRCHISNQKRRQIAQEAALIGRGKNADRDTKARIYKDQVRAYWRGEIDDHP